MASTSSNVDERVVRDIVVDPSDVIFIGDELVEGAVGEPLSPIVEIEEGAAMEVDEVDDDDSDMSNITEYEIVVGSSDDEVGDCPLNLHSSKFLVEHELLKSIPSPRTRRKL